LDSPIFKRVNGDSAAIAFFTRAHLQHQVATQQAIDCDAAPLAQRIAFAESLVADLDERVAQLDAIVKAATSCGNTNSAMRPVDNQAKRRAALVAERQQADEPPADL
jgi:hypothetical protein